MKLLCYIGLGQFPHPKNYHSIQRMCECANIDIEFTQDLERIQKNNYNILLSFFDFIDPDIIPKSVKVILGPQLFVIPYGPGPIIGKLKQELVDKYVYNSLSLWVKDYITELSEFIVPIESFPFSVDIDKFRPTKDDKSYDFLVYFKHRIPDLLQYTIDLLKQKNLVFKIFRYGSSLQDTKSMIVIDAHESQGFALQKAMSCNVPLLVLDVTSMYEEYMAESFTYSYLKPKNLYATSVPYWSDKCGIKTDRERLSKDIDRMLKTIEEFEPRQYIIENLSDKVCIDRILKYFNI